MNINFTFDQNLHEVPDAPQEFKAYLFKKVSELETIEDPFGRASHLSQIGALFRIIRRLDEAESFLKEADTLIQKHEMGRVVWVINRLRLAHVLQWKKVFEVSTEMFQEILEVCESDANTTEQLDFAWQHLGKNYFDQGIYDLALKAFQTALKIRQEKKAAPDLIRSSETAIAETKKRLRL